MSQHDMTIADGDGASVLADINNALPALASQSKGNNAPGTPYSGQPWVDDNTPSSTKWTESIYDGTDWIKKGEIDTTNNIYVAQVGGGTNTVASASTTDLGSVFEASITVSGTTTITSFGSSTPKGAFKMVTFSGALTITHNATSLILPGGANIVTASGDTLLAEHTGSGNWRVHSYTRASGSPVLRNTGFSATTTTTTAMTASVYTKIPFNTETFDQQAAYDPTTNYRFTPSIAGKYRVYARASITSVADGKIWAVAIYKNGSIAEQGFTYTGAAGTANASCDGYIDMNGSTDYLEVFGFNGDSSNRNITSTGTENRFFGYRVDA